MAKPYMKPCPFCGCYDVDILYGRDGYISNSYMPYLAGSVRCRHCGMGTRKHPQVEVAVQKWNKRAGDCL